MKFIAIYAKYLYKIPNFLIKNLTELIPIKAKRQKFRDTLFKLHAKYFYKMVSVSTINEKIIICRPHCGFNDMLVRIEKCCRYAETYGRTLYIDTSRSGILDNFGKYFVAPEGIFLDFSRLLSTPNTSKKDLKGLEIIINSSFDTRAVFDFSRDYSDQILIYEDGGGGDVSIYALERFTLQNNIKKHICRVVEQLGEYDAIHVRNSDYKTDYKKFFDQINDTIGDKIVLCTDSYECQIYAKKFWGDRLQTVTNIPDTKGRKLHDNKKLDRFQTNLDMLTDLFVLASAKKLYFTTMKKGWISGFGNLAKSLHERSDLIHKLLYQ